MIEFIENARQGVPLDNKTVMSMARLFQDELTLSNLPQDQLRNLCKYMGLPTFGGDVILRFHLRVKMGAIKDDDRRILWEGIDSLTTTEVQEACT